MPDVVVAEAEARFDVTHRNDPTYTTGEDLVAALRGYDAILATLGDGFHAGVFSEAGTPRAKIIANFGVGYNHIDVAAAQNAGIEVTNTPGAVTDATADIALKLILMTCRRAGEGERALRRGDWAGWHPTQYLGTHVSQRTVGIVGMGRIGKAIAKRCHFGFGMDVVFFNRSPVNDPGMPARQLDSLHEVMGVADIVVVAVPGGPATHHLIDAKALSVMRRDGHLVNIARGDVIEEAALIAALSEGRIAGAGLDVYEFEPKVPDALKSMENVVLLPHLGTAALDVREGMGRMALENLIEFFDGKTPPNVV